MKVGWRAGAGGSYQIGNIGSYGLKQLKRGWNKPQGCNGRTDRCRSGLSNRVAVDYEFDAAIALAAFGGVVGSHGLRLAESARGTLRWSPRLLPRENRARNRSGAQRVAD